MRLRTNELCPIHRSLSCCGREFLPSIRADDADLRLSEHQAGSPNRPLIIPAAPDACFAQGGMRLHRTNERSRRGSFGCWRMIGTGWVGAAL